MHAGNLRGGHNHWSWEVPRRFLGSLRTTTGAFARCRRASIILVCAVQVGCGWVDSTGRQGNEAPVIVVDDVSTFEQMADVSLDGSASSDADGFLETFEWALVAGNPAAIESFADVDKAVARFDTVTLNSTELLTFSLTVTDNDGGRTSHSIEVLVQSINDPPVAEPNHYETLEGGTLSITPYVFDDFGNIVGGGEGLLDNDSDDDDEQNEPLSARLKTGFEPRHGDIVVDLDGGFTYTHDGSDTVQDQFTYVVSDGVYEVDAEVTISLRETNDAPVANDDGAFGAYVVNEGGVLVKSDKQGVLANDTDSDHPHESLTAILETHPTHGSVAMSLKGGFTYTHNGSSDSAVDSFTYRAHDPLDQSPTSATVFITVGLLNDAPVANPDSFDLEENASLSVPATGVLANDSDEEGDPLSAVLASAPRFASAFTLNSDGSFVYAHNGDESAEDSFSYRAFDGSNNSESGTVTLHIKPVNDVPVAVADAYSVNIGETISTGAVNGVLANDIDPDGPLLRALLVSEPQNGQLIFEDDGSFSYTHAGAGLEPDIFSYRVTDTLSDGNTVSVAIGINADEENIPPVAGDECRVDHADGLSIVGELDDLVIDLDNTAFNFSLVAAPQKGSVNIDLSSGQYVYTSSSNERGYRDTFEYRVDDLRGGSDTGEVEIIFGARRIMPLGDSITAGVTGVSFSPFTISPEASKRIGYRKKLYSELEKKHFLVDFVGDFHEGQDDKIKDPDHQGTLVHKMRNTADGIQGWLSANPADIVLLHIGTHDHSVDASPIDGILANITSWSVNNNIPVQVFVARIIDQRHDSFYADTVEDFNRSLDRLLDDNWPDVVSVDQYEALDNKKDMSERREDFTGLHPSKKGYDKMARKWKKSLEDADILFTCD